VSEVFRNTVIIKGVIIPYDIVLGNLEHKIDQMTAFICFHMITFTPWMITLAPDDNISSR
jgi:hypothetical protein